MGRLCRRELLGGLIHEYQRQRDEPTSDAPTGAAVPLPLLARLDRAYHRGCLDLLDPFATVTNLLHSRLGLAYLPCHLPALA
jgi:hypothetical protein